MTYYPGIAWGGGKRSNSIPITPEDRKRMKKEAEKAKKDQPAPRSSTNN